MITWTEIGWKQNKISPSNLNFPWKIFSEMNPRYNLDLLLKTIYSISDAFVYYLLYNDWIGSFRAITINKPCNLSPFSQGFSFIVKFCFESNAISHVLCHWLLISTYIQNLDLKHFLQCLFSKSVVCFNLKFVRLFVFVVFCLLERESFEFPYRISEFRPSSFQSSISGPIRHGFLPDFHKGPDSKVHGAHLDPWILSAPDGPHGGPMNLDIGGHQSSLCIALAPGLQ